MSLKFLPILMGWVLASSFACSWADLLSATTPKLLENNPVDETQPIDTETLSSCAANPEKQPTSIYVYGAVKKQGRFSVTLCTSRAEELVTEALNQSEGIIMEHAIYDKIYVLNLSEPNQKQRLRVFDLKNMRFKKAGLFKARINQNIVPAHEYALLIPSDKDEHFMDLFKYSMNLAATFAVVFLGSNSR
ncbi:MAG: hypothetical protein VKK59_00290 [Vampirovibrionales bacterium]|nr:hypothetical protein [Vampirovibrionales bacterium]